MPVDNYSSMSLGVGEKTSEGNIRCMEPRLPEGSTRPTNQIQQKPLHKNSTILDVNITPEKCPSVTSKECEIEGDVGYSSIGTQEDNSQKSHLSVKISEWQENDDFMHPDNDLDDLLYHFNNFFHEKLENELSNFQESMRNMLTEQQIHVRQIVHNSSVAENLLDSPRNHMDTSELDLCSSSHSSPNEEDAFQASNGQQAEESGNNELLTELLSLSCAVTTLLHQSKYR